MGPACATFTLPSPGQGHAAMARLPDGISCQLLPWVYGRHRLPPCGTQGYNRSVRTGRVAVRPYVLPFVQRMAACSLILGPDPLPRYQLVLDVLSMIVATLCTDEGSPLPAVRPACCWTLAFRCVQHKFGAVAIARSAANRLAAALGGGSSWPLTSGHQRRWQRAFLEQAPCSGVPQRCTAAPCG